MNLKKSFRGNVKDIKNLSLSRYSQDLVFSSSYNDKGYVYEFTVSPRSYLEVAKKAVKALSRISGMDYRISAKHPLDTVWRAL